MISNARNLWYRWTRSKFKCWPQQPFQAKPKESLCGTFLYKKIFRTTTIHFSPGLVPVIHRLSNLTSSGPWDPFRRITICYFVKLSISNVLPPCDINAFLPSVSSFIYRPWASCLILKVLILAHIAGKNFYTTLVKIVTSKIVLIVSYHTIPSRASPWFGCQNLWSPRQLPP